MAADAQRDLDEALPALEAATASLKNLSRNDVVEVKSLSNPPAGVKLVMEVSHIHSQPTCSAWSCELTQGMKQAPSHSLYIDTQICSTCVRRWLCLSAAAALPFIRCFAVKLALLCLSSTCTRKPLELLGGSHARAPVIWHEMPARNLDQSLQ